MSYAFEKYSTENGNSVIGGLKALGTFTEFTVEGDYAVFDVGINISTKKLFVVIAFANGTSYTFPIFNGSTGFAGALRSSGVGDDNYMIFDLVMNYNEHSKFDLRVVSMPSNTPVTSMLASIYVPTLTLYEIT